MMINGAAIARMDACWRVSLAPARNPHVLPTRNNCCCAHMFATIGVKFMLYLIKREIREISLYLRLTCILAEHHVAHFTAFMKMQVPAAKVPECGYRGMYTLL
jgi:hypothetical protein